MDASRPDSATRWQQIEHLLAEALELAPEERQAFIEQAPIDTEMRQELGSLLAASDGDLTLLDRPAAARLSESVPEIEQAGPYRVIRPLGEGGMGSVYLAERSDGVHSARVALKLLHGSLVAPLLIQRFEAEREILASLRHPNIAQMLDGGTTSAGRPFLVMEWVEGLPIDAYCQQNHLDVRQLVELFVKVCSAVHFAHQNLIVHRDLKPGNILVNANGEPKLLDFGIAKLLAPEALPGSAIVTGTGLTPLTPAYASPEQVLGRPITTATDVYSLGVLFYELLCGSRPFVATEHSSLDLLQAICEQEPRKPSSRISRRPKQPPEPARDPALQRRRLAGDLDNIVLKALAKEPAQRYPSAEQLGADLVRFNQGLPVLAHRRSWAYVVGKFVRRNRLAVGASSLAVLLLLATLAALLLQRRQTILERDRAEFTTHFLVEQFRGADPWENPRDVTARELLDRGAERLRDVEAPAAVQAELSAAMGHSYAGIGRAEEARPLLAQALEFARQQDDIEEVGELTEALAELERSAGRYHESLRQAEASLEIRRQGTDITALVSSLSTVGKSLEKLGQTDEAATYLSEALELATLAELPPETIGPVMQDLGSLQSRQSDYDRAEQTLRKTLDLWLATYGKDHPRTGNVMNSLSSVLSKRGRLEDAAEMLLEATANLEGALASNHPTAIVALTNLGHVRQKQGDFTTAAATFERVLELCGDRPDLQLLRARALNRKAFLLQELRRHDESEAPLLEALELRRAVLGSVHPDVMKSLVTLGLLRRKQRDFDGADAAFEEALNITAATYGPDHPRNGTLNRHRANLRLDAAQRAEKSGDPAAAQRWQQEAMTLLENWLGFLEERLGDANPQVAAFYNTLGGARLEIHDYAAGRKAFETAVDMMSRALGPDHRKVALYRFNLGYLELEDNNPEVALQQARRAKALYDGAESTPYLDRLDTDFLVARCQLALGRAVEAEALLIPWLSWLEAGNRMSGRAHARLIDILAQAADAQGAVDRAERYRSMARKS
ncbi:MAG: serine/threonine-protein kinase [Acidobacteriota bacterium]